jgi:hypothetical protein
MVDEAVWSEPLSASNSLIIRENTGNLRDFKALRPISQLKKPRVLSGFSQNSLLNGTGNFKTRTGNYFEGTGNFFRITGDSVIGLIRDKKRGPAD